MTAGVWLFAVLGLLVGSFLNVCIFRLPREQSLMWPGSRCATCARALRWYENIPVLSWVALRGRCRTCGEPIAVMYPMVEIVTSVVFAGSYLVYGPTPLLAVRTAFACAMIVLFAIDLRHRILPNVITLPGIAAGVLASLALPPGPVSSLMGIVLGGGLLLALSEGYYRLRGHEGLGMGDVKMLAMIGAFLGWRLTLVTLFLASLAGSVIGLSMIAASRGGMKTALPFGTFLAVGALVASVVGEQLLEWYLGLY